MKRILVAVLLVPTLIIAYVVLQKPDPTGVALVAGLVIGLVVVALPRFGSSPREKLRGGLEGAPTDPAERLAYLRAFLLALGLLGYAHGLWRLVDPNPVRVARRWIWAWLHTSFSTRSALSAPRFSRSLRARSCSFLHFDSRIARSDKHGVDRRDALRERAR